eukprot:scaffold68700_cov65-Phaeocystis_antarctica.AAC.2
MTREPPAPKGKHSITRAGVAQRTPGVFSVARAHATERRRPRRGLRVRISAPLQQSQRRAFAAAGLRVAPGESGSLEGVILGLLLDRLGGIGGGPLGVGDGDLDPEAGPATPKLGTVIALKPSPSAACLACATCVACAACPKCAACAAGAATPRGESSASSIRCTPCETVASSCSMRRMRRSRRSSAACESRTVADSRREKPAGASPECRWCRCSSPEARLKSSPGGRRDS